MRIRIVVTGLLAIGIAAALHAPAAAQRAGGASRPPAFPTKEQFDASAEAQKHVAAAKKLAGTDLQTEFENTCSYTGPERVVLRRERLGLPPMKDYTVEPTKIFDNVYAIGTVTTEQPRPTADRCNCSISSSTHGLLGGR